MIGSDNLPLEGQEGGGGVVRPRFGQTSQGDIQIVPNTNYKKTITV